MRLERLDLFQQAVDQLLAGAARHGRDVVDRLVGVELGALAADLVEIVDQLAFHAEQAGLEHGEQAAGACADDDHVGPDDVLGHDGSGWEADGAAGRVRDQTRADSTGQPRQQGRPAHARAGMCGRALPAASPGCI